MSDQAPGERPRPNDGESRRLERAPGERYRRGARNDEGAKASEVGQPARGPIVRAVVITLVGSIALVLVAGVLALTSGLLFIAGMTGAAAGLVVAGAAAGDGVPALMSRRAVIRLAVVLALVGLVVVATGLWLVSRAQGGALGPIDLLADVYGFLIPATGVVWVLASAWGASAGPIRP